MVFLPALKAATRYRMIEGKRNKDDKTLHAIVGCRRKCIQKVNGNATKCLDSHKKKQCASKCNDLPYMSIHVEEAIIGHNLLDYIGSFIG